VTDSVDTLDVHLNSGDIETTIQNWLNTNSVTSVDDLEIVTVGRDRAVVTIIYTA
jgi:hypothetical protein